MSIAALCKETRADLAVARDHPPLPAADAQQLIADADGTGNTQLANDALAVVSASHVVDDPGVSKALARMVGTCGTLGH